MCNLCLVAEEIVKQADRTVTIVYYTLGDMANFGKEQVLSNHLFTPLSIVMHYATGAAV
jgi:hypothetical protein